LVVLEAAALGVPAIVADTSAARDLVRDGHTGLWFKGGDALSLRAAMQRLMVTQLAQDMDAWPTSNTGKIRQLSETTF